MNRKQNFIAIFAIALIAIGANLLTSCNADDEEYDFNGAYTMAGKLQTRAAENTTSTPANDTIYRPYDFHFTAQEQNANLINPVTDIRIHVKIYRKNNKPATDLICYECIDPAFIVDSTYFEESFWPNRYYLCANAHNGVGIIFKGKVEGITW